jgi:hypothetical protein
MENNTLPELKLNQPQGKRNTGSPRRGWRENDRLKTNGLRRTGLAAQKPQYS